MYRLIFAVIVLAMILTTACNLTEIIASNQEGSENNNLNSEAQLGYEDEEEYDEAGYYVLGELADSELEVCPPHEVEFITDLNIYQTPDLPELEPRTSFIDPTFGTCIVRVTDREDDILNPYDTSRGMKNEYARVQSFNADESLLMVWSIESFWYVYDAASLTPLGEVPVYVLVR